jgi:lycopene beta-cyclase
MKNDADLIILGGGCAGLSLAMQLAKLGEKAPRTLVLESRHEYVNDRTWCFWGHPDAAMSGLASHQWNAFSVSTSTRRIVRDCSAAPYRMIPSGAFYAAARERIARSPGTELLIGNPITSEPVREEGSWRVMSSNGTVSAKWIVDTRPVNPHDSRQPHLWQSFLGQEIVTEKECFDPECAELMDFSESTPSRILFLYLLPFSKNRALIEATVFGRETMSPEDLTPSLRSLLGKRLGGAGFSVMRSEHGILPMGRRLSPPHRGRGYVHAGLAAGGARPSTGYAFQRIQRWARECTAAVARGEAPLPHAADPVIQRAMDELFLRVLRARPDLAPGIFFSLFGNVEPRRIARFMSDRGRLSDYAAIIAALPPGPFLSELPGAVLARLGRSRNKTREASW